MSEFIVIQLKLERFIKRYYSNELLKGSILFAATGLLYFLFTLFVEYMFWLKPLARTILFWIFVLVELVLLGKFIAFPLLKLFKLKKGISYEGASQIIGGHFPEVNDKLLNVLQLKQNKAVSELLLASIDQKSAELKPIPFKLAISFRKNLKYLKYTAIPCFIFLVSFLTGKTEWFSDSYDRVVHYRMAYEAPAPFQFFVANNDLNAIESKDFKLTVSTTGEVIPENVQIHFNDETFFLQIVGSGQFEYVFTQPKSSIEFYLSANNVSSKTYTLNVTKTPILLDFEMIMDYPSYLNKNNESLKSTGSAIVPEGTSVNWKVNTKSTDKVSIYSIDTIKFESIKQDRFEATKRLFNNFDYTISTSNYALKDYENLSFSIRVIKDEYPELNVHVEKDSIDGQTLYFWGQVSDDYGLSKLQLVYYPIGAEQRASHIEIPIAKSSFDDFLCSFPNMLELLDGISYELYLQVFDNDAIHNFKSVKSKIFSFRKLTGDEMGQKQLKEQNETIKDITKTFDRLKEQDKRLEELSKIQKEKQELNFNDKKKFENFLKRQREQEELMRNFNEKLKENIENFEDKNNKENQFREDLIERIQENEDQLKQDEKLLEELEKMQEKIEKEEFTEKLEELAKQSKNKQRSLKQLLELTKRYYVAKKAEKLRQELENLSKEQNQLSEEKKENNTKEKQEKLNRGFEDFQKEMDELKKDDNALQKPLDIPQDKLLEEEIKTEQREALEDLKQEEEIDKMKENQQSHKDQNAAKKKQKSAAEKMKQLSDRMKMSAAGVGMDQLSEDADMLRQILDNLVLFSFDQEDLMNSFKSIDINNNQYSKFLRNQSALREHFEHIDDSLFALSLRQPKISENINEQITEVFFNIDKSLNQLSENQIYQGISSQQYTLSATNVLASFLSDILDNIEAQMSMMPGQGNGSQEMQLPDIIMGQVELRKEMEKGLKNGKADNPKSDKDKTEPEENISNDELDNSNGRKEGEGEVNKEDNYNELYEIYKRQQELRQALEDKLGKNWEKGEGQKIIKEMEEIELDLINKGFTNQTIQKMQELEYQLLKLENASFFQGIDDKRQSKTNYDSYRNNSNELPPALKENTYAIEILNRQTLPLKEVYKIKVQQYFKKGDD